MESVLNLPSSSDECGVVRAVEYGVQQDVLTLVLAVLCQERGQNLEIPKSGVEYKT